MGEGRYKVEGGLSGIFLCGFGYAYDYTGDRKYLERGLQVLERTAAADGERVKTFAQQFRASPYFLKALTVGYEPEAALTSHAENE